MPRDKDLKRLVRARMEKTGESYTAARAQVMRKSSKGAPGAAAARTTSAAARSTSAPARATPAAGAGTTDPAMLAGMSDAKVREKTGRAWEDWVRVLDGHGADRMPHREIAALVNGRYEVDGWWAQTVTVGYERIKGLRARGQRRNGTYEASKSRTFNVPITTLYEAWSNASRRKRWLTGARVKVRTATPPKSMRLDWNDSGIVVVGFDSRGPSKSVVALAHTKLPDRESAHRLKEYWTERLDSLARLLAPRTG